MSPLCVQQDPGVQAVHRNGGTDPATDSGLDAHPGPILCTSFSCLGNVFGTPYEAVRIKVEVLSLQAVQAELPGD